MGADVNTCTKSSAYPAICAATENRYDLVLKLLDQEGALVNILWQGNSVICACVAVPDMVRDLIDRKADVTIGNPLYKAIESGVEESVMLIAEAGANITSTHIRAAAKIKSSGMVRALMDLCDDPAGKGSEALLETYETPRDLSVLRTLVKCGANVNAVHPVTGQPALSFAISKCPRLETVHIILENGVDLDAPYYWGMNAVLHYVSQGGSGDVLTYLLRRVDKNITDDYGTSALMIACTRGNSNAARCLFRHRVDLHHRDGTGANAIVYAVNGLGNALDLEIASFLLDQGVDVESHGSIILTRAVRNVPTDDFIVRLVDHGARVSVDDFLVLNEAVDKFSPQVVETLIKAGACAVYGRMVFNHGSPLFTAIKNDDLEMVAILLKHGARPNMSHHGLLYACS